MEKFIKRVKRWLGYHNGPVNIYTGHGFSQGAGFNVYVDAFEIKKLGIKYIKEVKVQVDPFWYDNLKKRLIKDMESKI